MSKLGSLVRERILILDGAMGTMIQQYNLTEEDFRGERFSQISGQMKGNNDLLCLTRPDVIQDIHRKYLAAGADIIETNTFSSTRISMADYHVQDYVREMNLAAARLAREVADEFTSLTPHKPRFVAGSVGPTNKTCSMSPDVNNPAFRALSYDELADAYREQIEALLEGGVDALLIETIFDTLNAKAAIFAAGQAMETVGVHVPLMLSVTVSDIGGRTLSGQTLDAFLASVQHADIFSIGLNCSFGARQLKPFLEQLAVRAPYYISAYPIKRILHAKCFNNFHIIAGFIWPVHQSKYFIASALCRQMQMVTKLIILHKTFYIICIYNRRLKRTESQSKFSRQIIKGFYYRLNSILSGPLRV